MKLPKSVQQLADVIGEEKALRLARKLRDGDEGRQRWLYIPTAANLHINHKLVTLLGWADAMALCEELGGSHVFPSACRYLERAIRNRRVLALCDLGYSKPEIAIQLGLSEKWVDSILDARDMLRRGTDVEVIAHSVKISPLTLGYIFDIDVDPDIGPVKRRGHPRQPSPQMGFDL